MSAKLKTFTVEFSWLLPLYVHQQIEAPNLADALAQAQTLWDEDKIDFNLQKESWDYATQVRLTGVWAGKPYDTASLLPDELEVKHSYALAREVAPAVLAELMPDPRRVVIVAHTDGTSPRARRWYSLRLVVDFLDDQGMLPLRTVFDTGLDGSRRLADWVKTRDQIAAQLNVDAVKGVWRDKGQGEPMELIGSPKA